MNTERGASVPPNLHDLSRFNSHDRTLCIAAGGPSLADTIGDLTGDVVTVNASLDYVMNNWGKPWACGIADRSEHIADLVTPYSGVFYFVESRVHSNVWDKLSGCEIIRWYTTEEKDKPLQIGGGCTMGLRWFNIGYILGYRKFHFHGMDSSYRKGMTHAYPDRRDGKEHMIVEGYETAPNFMEQVIDFIALMERIKQPDIEPVEITVHGEGLLQSKYAQHRLLESQ